MATSNADLRSALGDERVLGATSTDRLIDELDALGWEYRLHRIDLYKVTATVDTNDGTMVSHTAPTAGRALFWALRGARAIRGEFP